MQWLHAMAPCNGSMQWLHAMAPCNWPRSPFPGATAPPHASLPQPPAPSIAACNGGTEGAAAFRPLKASVSRIRLQPRALPLRPERTRASLPRASAPCNGPHAMTPCNGLACAFFLAQPQPTPCEPPASVCSMQWWDGGSSGLQAAENRRFKNPASAAGSPLRPEEPMRAPRERLPHAMASPCAFFLAQPLTPCEPPASVCSMQWLHAMVAPPQVVPEGPHENSHG